MNTQTQEALKMAIDVMEGRCAWGKSKQEVIAMCQEALEQPAQEPVAWDKIHELLCKVWHRELNADEALDEMQLDNFTLNPLYTHPAPSWQGLSDDEIWEFINKADIPADYDREVIKIARAIEQALKEKNHG